MSRTALQTMALGCLTAAAIGCAYGAGITILSPLEATEQQIRSSSSTELLAILQDPKPVKFTPVALLASPLFLATRTPVRVTAPIPETVVERPVASVALAVDHSPPDYILAGVMISSSERKVLLRKHTAETGLWIRHGKSTADGWVVLTVGAERVTLIRDQKEYGLLLRSQEKIR